MLTPDQENYLKKIPAGKMVEFFPYDPKTPEIAEKIIKRIKKVAPGLEVLFMGASALGISGQSDIDLSVFCPETQFEKYEPLFVAEFGDAKGGSVIEWNFTQDCHEITIYLTDPTFPSTKEQIDIFRILQSDKALLKEYEELKESFSNKSYREYQEAKYNFYNRALKANLVREK